MTVGRLEAELSSKELSEWMAIDEWKNREKHNAERLALTRERHMKQFGRDPLKD